MNVLSVRTPQFSIYPLAILIAVLVVALPSHATAEDWSQLGSDIDGEAADDWSGWSVSLSSDGSRVAIGAPDNGGNGTFSGHVRIFEWAGAAWSQLGSDIDGEAAEDFSGFSVSLSSDGSRVAIGATGNDGNGNASGHVRIFEWNGAAWSQIGADIDGEAAGDVSGWSVSLSSDGSRVAIGAVQNDGNGPEPGHVRIFSAQPSPTAELEITRARITRAGDKPGTLRVRGTAPGSAEEQIDASGGLTVTVSTGSGLTKVVEFAASNCRTWSRGARPGSIVCWQRLGGYDRPQLRLKRLYSAGEATGSYKLRYRAGGLSSGDTADLAGPITVTISEGDLDHTGEADTCVTTRKALRCG